MAEHAASSTGVATYSDWSPARIYLVASGVFLVVIATVGFAINRAFPIGAGEVRSAGSDHIFGIFETNGWHSVAGLISALWRRVGEVDRATDHPTERLT